MAEPKAPATEAPASTPAPPSAVNSAPSFDWQTFKPQESFKSLLHIYEKVESDGTVLRKFFGSVRHSVSDAIGGVKGQVSDLQTAALEKMEAVVPFFKKFESEFTSVDDFRKKHRELTIAGVSVAFALPFALRGKRAMLWNGLLAAGGTVAAMELMDFWERRHKKQRPDRA